MAKKVTKPTARKVVDQRMFTAEEKKSKKPCTKTKHWWYYAGGECICRYCGKYLQPSGRITLKP